MCFLIQEIKEMEAAQALSLSGELDEEEMAYNDEEEREEDLTQADKEWVDALKNNANVCILHILIQYYFLFTCVREE